MTRVVRLLVVLLAFSTAAACGSNPNSPSKVSYAGTWNGTYNITACTPTGDFITNNPCPTLGTSGSFQLVLTQSDTIVSGSFTLGSLSFISLGSKVASDGSLPFEGAAFLNPINIDATFNLTEPSSTTLTGTIDQTWTAIGLNGQVLVHGTLSTTTKQ